MKKRTQSKILAVASVLSLGCVFGGATLLTNAAKAETANTAETVQFQMIGGASVRLSEKGNGLRFGCTLPEAEYLAIEENDAYDNVSYGIMIAPKDYVTTAALTTTDANGKATINTAAYDWAKENEQGELVYTGKNGADGSQKRIINLTSDTMAAAKDGNYAFYASIVNLKDGVNATTNNIAREFVGVGYIAYTVGGNTYYEFAEDNDNTRSMAYVAQAAIEKGVEGDLAEEQLEMLQTTYLSRVATTATNYKVNYWLQGADGKYALSEEYSKAETTTIGAPVNVTPADLDGYTCKSEAFAGKAYANDKTAINFYYKKDVEVNFANKPLYYTEGAAFNVADLGITANYAGGEATAVEATVVGTADMTAGDKTVTISFEYNGETYEAEYNYIVVNASVAGAIGYVVNCSYVTLYKGINYYEQNGTYEIGVEEVATDLTALDETLKAAYNAAVAEIIEKRNGTAEEISAVAFAYEKKAVATFQAQTVANLKAVTDGMNAVFNYGIFDNGKATFNLHEGGCEATKAAYGEGAWDARVDWGRCPEAYTTKYIINYAETYTGTFATVAEVQAWLLGLTIDVYKATAQKVMEGMFWYGSQAGADKTSNQGWWFIWTYNGVGGLKYVGHIPGYEYNGEFRLAGALFDASNSAYLTNLFASEATGWQSIQSMANWIIAHQVWA